MKKISVLLTIVIMMIMISGCSIFQKSIKGMAKDDAKNAETTRLAARQICSTWALNSSALSVILEKYKGLLPCDCGNDIAALDGISNKCVIKDTKGNLTCEELTDTDMGKAVVTWGYIWGQITKSGIETIMKTFFPSVLTRITPYVTALGL